MHHLYKNSYILIYFCRKEWHPFVYLADKTDKTEEEKQREAEMDEQTLEQVKFDNYMKKAWRKIFQPFYNPKSLAKPMSEQLQKKSLNAIIREVKYGIITARSAVNMVTKWKPQVN